MNKWTQTKQLSTYTVDKQLIERIEDYYTNTIPKILKIEEPIISRISIDIVCNKSIERYASIKELPNQYFQDNVKEITVEFNLCDRWDAIVIETRFNRNCEKSLIYIQLKHETPAETFAGICHGIVRLINDNRNLNRLIYPKDQILFPLLVLGSILGVAGIFSAVKEIRSISITFLLFLLIYIGISRFLLGYCSFNSKRQRLSERIILWIFVTIIGFLITTLLSPIGKMIFGFLF